MQRERDQGAGAAGRRRRASSEPRSALRRGLAGFALGLTALLGATSSQAESVEPARVEAPVATVLSIDAAPPLEELLVLPSSESPREVGSGADRVGPGTGPPAARVSGFRKRSTDLFRTDRAVEIGQREMLLRLRLRAKSRETMSVELRF